MSTCSVLFAVLSTRSLLRGRQNLSVGDVPKVFVQAGKWVEKARDFESMLLIYTVYSARSSR